MRHQLEVSRGCNRSRRRDFIAILAGGAAAGWLGPAWGAQKPRLIAVLAAVSQSAAKVDMDAFLAGMRELGYVEGSQFVMAYRYADGYYGRLPELAKELMALNPDLVLAAGGSLAALAIKAISSTVPIVSPILDHEIDYGLAASDARPGGNVTGIDTDIGPVGLDAKTIELAHDALPSVVRIGLLINASNKSKLSEVPALEAAAAKLGLTMTAAEARVPGDIPQAFEKFNTAGCEAVVVSLDSMFFSERVQIAALAAKARLPDFYGTHQNVEAGGLMSYGISVPANFRRAAYFVDRIWNGTPPGDLPIEFPTKLELVINQKRANELGITIPQSVMVRADEVID